MKIKVYKTIGNWKSGNKESYSKYKETKGTAKKLAISQFVEQSVTLDSSDMVNETVTIQLWSKTNNLKELARTINDFADMYESSSISLYETSWSDSSADLVLLGKRKPTEQELAVFNRLKEEYENQDHVKKLKEADQKELAEWNRLKAKYGE